jgi:hypothetical protein
MSANTSPIYPIAPYIGTASLTAVTACTTRAPLAVVDLASNNLVQLTQTTNNGVRIDKIQVQACSTSITAPTANQSVLIWLCDGVTAWVIDEIPVTATTPSTIASAFQLSRAYSILVLPSTHTLYTSTTVTTTASTTALAVIVFGGNL